MGSSASKVARGAPRKYPTAPSATATATRVAPRARTGAAAQTAADEGNRDDAGLSHETGSDAVSGDFSQRLQQLGVVQPNPTYSPSSIATNVPSPPGIPDQTIGSPQFPPNRANPTLSALESRRRLQVQAERDFEALGSVNSAGRRLIDMRTLVDALQLLNRGMCQRDVEKKLQLETGLLGKLGGPLVISHEVTSSTV